MHGSEHLFCLSGEHNQLGYWQVGYIHHFRSKPRSTQSLGQKLPCLGLQTLQSVPGSKCESIRKLED
jgi:hypothetical protein